MGIEAVLAQDAHAVCDAAGGCRVEADVVDLTDAARRQGKAACSPPPAPTGAPIRQSAAHVQAGGATADWLPDGTVPEVPCSSRVDGR